VFGRFTDGGSVAGGEVVLRGLGEGRGLSNSSDVVAISDPISEPPDTTHTTTSQSLLKNLLTVDGLEFLVAWSVGELVPPVLRWMTTHHKGDTCYGPLRAAYCLSAPRMKHWG
jgi:hypothetical protein